nr:thiamine pyrophosphate-binding protein [Actinomycetota bacterium]
MVNHAPYDEPEWGSDVMADIVRKLGFRFVSLNPGATFRGLHDSLVNYAGNEVTMIECPHEKIAMGLAHGFTKASGEPMAVILHDLVGLLHGTMGVYYAYIDRVPVFVMGGSGPAAHDKRRPNIDWIHSANVQGEAVRPYTKWDHEPRTVESLTTIMARAYRVAMTEPRGPVYIALDAGLQEQPLDTPVPTDDLARLAALPSKIGPDPEALHRLAEVLCAAERPVMVLGYAGRDPAAFGQLTELAELVGVGAIDTGLRLNFPNQHQLSVTGSDAMDSADCVLFVDVKDMGKPTQKLDSITRTVVSRLPAECSILDLGFNDLGLSSWSEDYAELLATDVQVTADTSLALPMLLEECRRLVSADDDARRTARDRYRDDLRQAHDKTWAAWSAAVSAASKEIPVATATLAAEVWEVVKDHDW